MIQKLIKLLKLPDKIFAFLMTLGMILTHDLLMLFFDLTHQGKNLIPKT